MNAMKIVLLPFLFVPVAMRLDGAIEPTNSERGCKP
jgi:hypothetical protein